MRSLILSVVLLLITYSCSTSNKYNVNKGIKGSNFLERPNEPGKCYAKAKIPDTYENGILTKKGGQIEWKEVLCEADITPRFYRKMQESLLKAGYEVEVSGNMDSATKEALIQYQKANGLPIGALDIETLAKLGVL